MAANQKISCISVCVALIVFILSAAALLCNAATESVTLNLTAPTKTTYTRALNEIRDFMKGKQAPDGIPMMAPPPAKANYVIVKLIASPDISLSVAVNKSNLYIVGYADEASKKAYLFNESKQANPSDVFPDIRVTLTKAEFGFGSGYNDLHDASGLDRVKVEGSLVTFRSKMVNVVGKDYSRNYKEQATFILYATQAISEATRFTYIQNKFSTEVETTKMDATAVSLENDWSTISKAVKAATKRVLQPAVNLSYPNGSNWKVRTVDEIKPLVAILLYVK